MKRTFLAAAVVLALGNASLVLAGLYDDIYQGLQILGTPSGYPLSGTGDGTRVNGQRSGRVRIVSDRVGQGYRLEFDRTFGVDSRNRPETLDVGLADLTLSGSLKATMGYTSRGNFLTGNADLQASNLSYELRGKTGVQDFDLTGTFNLSGIMEVNELGFYTLNLSAENTNSTLTVDGVVAQGTNTTNFAVGPIAVKGNVFIDGWVALLRSAGVDTSALDPLVAKSPVNDIIDTIRNDLQNAVAEATLSAAKPIQLPAVPPGVDSTGNTDAQSALAATATSGSGSTPSLAPEPSALMLVTLGSALLWRWRRR